MSNETSKKISGSSSGSISSRSCKSKSESNKRRKTSHLHRPTQSLQSKVREQGLSTALNEKTCSVGHSLLLKMGYQAGKGLGKTGQGRIEPPVIVLRQGSSGIGEAERVSRQKLELALVLKLEKERAASARKRQEASFLSRQSRTFAAKYAEKDLEQARKLCESLDKKSSRRKRHSLWPDKGVDSSYASESDSESDYDPSAESASDGDESSGKADARSPHLLDQALSYLRSVHFYCMYCGCHFNDQEDLASSCPGFGRIDH